jgi:hypothetical protein
MDHKFTGTHGREAIVELSDADLQVVSAADGYLWNSIMDGICAAGAVQALTIKSSTGQDYVRTCPK